MKPKLNMDKIVKRLGGQRRGTVTATGGYFGALELAAEVTERFRVPVQGGRATDPSWTERRQLPLRPETLDRLEQLVAKIRARGGRDVHPMQLAALLLEKVTKDVKDDDAVNIVESRH